MSFTALRWALAAPTSSTGTFAVLIRLADHHNETTGLCCPSVELLAEEVRASARAVKSWLAELRGAGLVTWKRTQKGSRYTLYLDSPKCTTCTSQVHHVHFPSAPRALALNQEVNQENNHAAGARIRKPPKRGETYGERFEREGQERLVELRRLTAGEAGGD